MKEEPTALVEFGRRRVTWAGLYLFGFIMRQVPWFKVLPNVLTWPALCSLIWHAWPLIGFRAVMKSH